MGRYKRRAAGWGILALILGISMQVVAAWDEEWSWEKEWKWEEEWELNEMREVWETETLETKESSSVVHVSDIHPHYEEGYKVYDGNCSVSLSCLVENLPDSLTLSLIGQSESPDEGFQEVMVEAFLSGEGAEDYQVVMDPDPVYVEIRPRPLYLYIGDARRPYYHENILEELYFDEMEPVKVTGFLTDEVGNPVIPEDFSLPDITIDPGRIQKESPMYQNGQERIYEGALTVKYREDGTLTGNPGANYCFCPEDETYLRKGNIRLISPFAEEGRDYQILSGDGTYVDTSGNIWIKSGDFLQILPISGSGFYQGTTFGPLYEGGSREFVLTAADPEGGIAAKSQIRSITWNVDQSAPTGTFFINGQEDDQTAFYTSRDIRVSLLVQDSGSGVKMASFYLAREEEAQFTPESIYQSNPYGWQEGADLLISQEGSYCVMARLEDQVGNVSYKKSKILVIDRTPPQIRIENVMDQSANSGNVLPVLYARDENLKGKAITFHLSGFRTGKRQINYKREEMESLEMIEMEGFPEEEQWDDRYHLDIRAEDLAGNVSQKEITFSVNRFGSTYYMEESQSEMLKNYYLKEPVDLKIHEVNVDQILEQEVMLGWEDTIRFLKKDEDYTVETAEEVKGKLEYTYHIKKENFSRDGHYYLALSSKDQAMNYSDNRLSTMQIEFAIDKRPPLVIATGVEDGQQYRKERYLNLECIDNLELETVQILIDGKERGDGISPKQKILLQEGDAWQEITILAEDKAGNISEPVYIKTYIGERNPETEGKEEREKTEERPVILPETEETKTGKILYFVAFLLILKGILWIGKKVNR